MVETFLYQIELTLGVLITCFGVIEIPHPKSDPKDHPHVHLILSLPSPQTEICKHIQRTWEDWHGIAKVVPIHPFRDPTAPVRGPSERRNVLSGPGKFGGDLSLARLNEK